MQPYFAWSMWVAGKKRMSGCLAVYHRLSPRAGPQASETPHHPPVTHPQSGLSQDNKAGP